MSPAHLAKLQKEVTALTKRVAELEKEKEMKVFRDGVELQANSSDEAEAIEQVVHALEALPADKQKELGEALIQSAKGGTGE